MARGFLRYPSSLALLLPAAFLSGATALVYEIVWARKLGIVLGSTTAAAAAVLSSFMLGLAIGAVVVGRRADTSSRPLRWYGVLELGIGVYAIMFDSVLDLVVGMGGGAWIGAFILLIVPTALMGGTIPVLARAASDTIRRGAGSFGILYGVNTIGAVAGALAAVFWFLPALGMAGAVMVAAVLNIVIGVAFWVLGMMAGPREVYEDDEAPPVSTWTGDMEPGVALTFFVAGFAGLALQMAWTRLLVFHLEGFTIAFGLMLATYLLGLGTGALGGTWAALQSMNTRRLLARVLLVQAVLALATFLFTGWIGASLEETRAGYLEAAGIDFSLGSAMFWAAMLVIFPATFCGGMLMPIVARIALADRESIGRHAGVVYAASTFGAVLAPPIAGFWLLPSLGVPATIALLGAILLAGGTYLAFARGLREWIFAGAAAVAFVVVCLAADLSTPLVERSHVFEAARTPRRLLAYEHGRLGEVAVVEELKDGARRLYIDGFSAAETGAHYGYMRMQAHLPVLLHPKPERVCVIAFGTGTTAGAVTVHADVKRVVCIEIEEAVYRVAPYFAEQNRNVLGGGNETKLASANPDGDASGGGGGGGMEIVPLVADGREYVRRGVEKFDVITLEPLMPYTPAAVYLYTQEFYEDTRKSLAPGGVLCQWIPPQGVSNDDMKRLIASVDAAFPFTSVWYFKHAVLVVGGDAAPRLDKTIVDRTTRAAVLEDLALAAVGDAAHLLGAHVCSGAALKDALGGAAPMVDDKTDLEFRPLARGLGKRSHTYFTENLEWLASVHQDDVAWLAGVLPGVETAVKTHGAVLDTLAKEMRGRLEGGTRVPASALSDVLAKDKTARFAQTIHDTRLYEELLAAGHVGEAAQLTLAQDRSLAYLALAEGEEKGSEQRAYYLILALRQNNLLDPRVGAKDGALRAEARDRASTLLDELAGVSKGAEARFCRNRARALRGEALEDGEEALPAVPLPDVAGPLAAGDIEAARAALVKARQADFGAAVERQIMEWFEGESDKRAALAALEAVGSQNTLRAAIKVARSGHAEDLAAVAPVFCARYPTMRRWEQLTKHRSPQVRMAAADAAKAHGSRAHLPALSKMCSDPEESVRLSAFVAFRDIEPAADRTGYDYRTPTDEAAAALAELAGAE